MCPFSTNNTLTATFHLLYLDPINGLLQESFYESSFDTEKVSRDLFHRISYSHYSPERMIILLDLDMQRFRYVDKHILNLAFLTFYANIAILGTNNFCSDM